MEAVILEENHHKKFAVIPYKEYLYLKALAEEDNAYQKAVSVLKNKKDRVLDYDSSEILKNPITRRREELGLSQADLARKLNVNPSYISRLESLRANPSKNTLENLALVLQCSLKDLV